MGSFWLTMHAGPGCVASWIPRCKELIGGVGGLNLSAPVGDAAYGMLKKLIVSPNVDRAPRKAP